MFLQPGSTLRVSFALAVFGGLLAFASDAAAAEAGRVIGIRGSVLATTGDGESRPLSFDSAVHVGDKIQTLSDAGVGLLIGSHYVGLDEGTTAVLRTTATSAPDLHVLSGRARVMDSGDGAQARLATDTLVAANAGSDTDIFAFDEKGGLVSMICPSEGSVTAQRGGQTLSPGAGDCAVAKAGEPLYPAKASHGPLAMLAQTGGFDPNQTPIVSRGVPLPPVALGLEPVANLATNVGPFSGDPRRPCDSPAACGLTAGSTPVVVNPPVNPPGPGTPPGGGGGGGLE